MAEQSGSHGKESFVGAQDRPEVRLNPDEPITSLRVRDLIALLGLGAVGTKSAILDLPGQKSHLKDVFDVPPKSVVKDISDASIRKEVKDAADTYVTGGGGVDPTLLRTVDALVREVAQLREAVNQLKR